jgi:hypothetical protein
MLLNYQISLFSRTTMCGLLEIMTMYMTGYGTVGDNGPEGIAKGGVIVDQKISVEGAHSTIVKRPTQHASNGRF